MTPAAAQPDFGRDPLWQQAQGYLRHRQVVSARVVLASMRRQRGNDDLYTHLLAAQIAWLEDRVRDGAADALAAARVAPDDPNVLCALAGMLLDMGETVAARDCLARSSVAGCKKLYLLVQFATLHKRLDQHDKALALADRAKSQGFDTPLLRYTRGHALLFNGRFEEAEVELASSLTAAPEFGQAAVPLVQLRRQTPEHNYLTAIEAGVSKAPPGSADHAAVEFARYKTLEDLGRDDEAWQALVRGNALMQRRVSGIPKPNHDWMNRFRSAWPLARAAAAATSRDPLPIFIIGMPRSGTTLLERMLGNHSQVADAGELMDLAHQFYWAADTRDTLTEELLVRLPRLDYEALGRRYLEQTQWRAAGKRYLIDKRPLNWMFAGVIHSALPQAPILHLVRDAMDVCFSNWRTYFGDVCEFSYDLDELASYFGEYQRSMAHWHKALSGAILDVSYAELVREPEATLRKVFEFCGLEWEPGCVDLARNVAPSATPSAAHIRQSIYTDRLGQWQRYASQLEPLRRALAADWAVNKAPGLRSRIQ